MGLAHSLNVQGRKIWHRCGQHHPLAGLERLNMEGRLVSGSESRNTFNSCCECQLLALCLQDLVPLLELSCWPQPESYTSAFQVPKLLDLD